jgi:hypothetical protein
VDSRALRIASLILALRIASLAVPGIRTGPAAHLFEILVGQLTFDGWQFLVRHVALL